LPCGSGHLWVWFGFGCRACCGCFAVACCLPWCAWCWRAWCGAVLCARCGPLCLMLRAMLAVACLVWCCVLGVMQCAWCGRSAWWM